jgi:predicted nucleic acid-binding protein
VPSRPLVIDANILIQAVLGDRVRGLIERYCGAVVFYVAEPNVEEATEYPVEWAAKRGVADETWRQSLQTVMVVIKVVPVEELVPAEAEAEDRIGRRDQHDWSAPAAALRFDCPVWTKDEDFFGSGAATWTTSTVEVYLRGE